MTAFKTGVHTIEFKTDKYIKLSDLPPAYDDAIKPEGKKRYRLNITKLPGMQEYNSPADTQKAIEDSFCAFADMGAGYPKTTRIDYRLDDHDGTYTGNLPLMTVLVNLIAYRSGIYDRRVFYLDGNGVTTSVRCMPDDKDELTRYGVEYYDKPRQAKSDVYGKARLELRRLNLSNESVPFVVKEWRDILQSITKKEYLAMLEEHALHLSLTRQDGEKLVKFIQRTRPKLIAGEEEKKLYDLNGKRCNHMHANKMGLPRWKHVQPFIKDIITQLNEALAKPQSTTFHPNAVKNELPF